MNEMAMKFANLFIAAVLIVNHSARSSWEKASGLKGGPEHGVVSDTPGLTPRNIDKID